MIISDKLDKANVEDILALTPTQEGMLFHYLNEPESDQYFEQLSITLTGNTDIQKLKEAWEFVVQTNEMLRTIFRWTGLKKPVQIVLKNYSPKILEYDFSNAEKEVQDILVGELKKNDKKNRIDITTEPCRILLCKLNDSEYEMIISNHHIIYDGWSTGILLKEFFAAYEALSENKRPEKVTKNRFKEFVKWHQNYDKERHAEFWRNYFSGLEANTALYKDNKDRGNTCLCESYHAALWEDLSKKLISFSKENEITLATLLYTAWGILLQKYSNSNDVVFGTTVSGRTPEVKGVEDIVGLFITTLPLRVQAKENESVIQLLKRQETDTRERGDFERTPLVDIKSYAGLHGADELFDSIVVIENYPLDASLSQVDGNISVKKFSMFEMTNFDLNLGITTAEDINLNFLYNGNSFTQAVIARMANHYIKILEQIANQSDIKLSDINILTEYEIHSLLFDFNNTAKSYPSDKTISQLFAEQVSKTPNNIAAVYNGQSLTYSELDKRAAALASLLRQKGIKANQYVGLMAQRSLEMMVGIIAIFKAGGVYLPVDPDYPDDRINIMLEDSGASILLTQKKLQDKVRFDGEIIDLEDEGLIGDKLVVLDEISTPADLAYVIYTSGSTGKPKGVEIENRSLVNLCYWYKDAYAINEKSKVLLIIPCGFDASIKNIITPLIIGGSVILAPAGYYDPYAVLETIKTNEVTLINCVPSAIYPVVDLASQDNYKSLKSLRNLLLGGESMTLSRLEAWLGRQECKCTLSNIYGPTECTDISVAYVVKKEEISTLKTVPIGKPINNIQAYIVNKHNNLQPVGVAGELVLSGDGVARGYLSRPELTNEKFVPNPFSNGQVKENNCQLMYRTGDLARWMTDGNIEFIGRIDNQVKIRGYRIEISEIEAQILSYPKVKEATVIDNVDVKGRKSLYAYIIPNEKFEIPELREYLSKDLPGYMIPEYFALIEALPLTPNGKINRKALAGIEAVAYSGVEFVAAENEIEIKIVDIWQSILGNKKIGMKDNFFEIGGNSILIVQMHSSIDKIYPGVLTVTDIFSYPTIEKLAGFISERIGTKHKEVSLKALTLPEDYFGEHIGGDNNSVFKFSLKDEYFLKIEKIAIKESVDAFDVLLAVYIYLFTEITEKRDLTVHTLSDNSGIVAPVRIKLDEISDFSNLFRLVNEHRNKKGGNDINDVINLPEVSLKKEKTLVIPLFYRTEAFTSSKDLTGVFDIALGISKNPGHIDLTCQYNMQRLKKDKIKELVSDYIMLIETIADRY
ncbi:MAG: amino acid adenylation domain-containing protein [Clostridia bacterium]|nr:amino acid adenylation domain-containing protein [Clostridia bacterium]